MGRKVEFRRARREDAGLILQFIRSLAEYERMSEEVAASEELLEDLYVFEEFRGKGYGKALLQELARITVERGCGRLEWCCLDWNRPSIEFYRSVGAKSMDEWTTFRLTGDTLAKMANIPCGLL